MAEFEVIEVRMTADGIWFVLDYFPRSKSLAFYQEKFGIDNARLVTYRRVEEDGR